MAAPYVVNYKLGFDVLMLGLLNNDNGKTYTSSQVQFGTVTSNDGTKNSKVTVTAIGDNPNKGSTVLEYNRVDMNTLNPLPFTFQTSEEYVNYSDILPLVNAHYDLDLTAADIVDAPLPITPSEAVPLPIVPTHGVWLKGCDVTITEPA